MTMHTHMNELTSEELDFVSGGFFKLLLVPLAIGARNAIRDGSVGKAFAGGAALGGAGAGIALADEDNQ